MKLIKTSLIDNDEISLSRTIYREGMLMDPHHHEHTAISVVLKGAVHETVDNLTHVGHASQVIIKPEGTTHANHYSGDCTILCLYLKDVRLSAINRAALLENWNWMSGHNLIPLFLGLFHQSSRQSIQAQINSILKKLNESQNTRQHLVPSWLADVKALLDESYHQPVQVEKLAEMFKVHRVYLTRAFKMHYGQSIKAYLKNIRLHHSLASVMEGDTLVEAALANGFSDQSHFNRIFKDNTHLTPGTLRSLLHNKVSFVQDTE